MQIGNLQTSLTQHLSNPQNPAEFSLAPPFPSCRAFLGDPLLLKYMTTVTITLNS
jgi:hypothetical protein